MKLWFWCASFIFLLNTEIYIKLLKSLNVTYTISICLTYWVMPTIAINKLKTHNGSNTVNVYILLTWQSWAGELDSRTIFLYTARLCPL